MRRELLPAIHYWSALRMKPKGCYRDTNILYDGLELCCNCIAKYNGKLCRGARKEYNRVFLWLWV